MALHAAKFFLIIFSVLCSAHNMLHLVEICVIIDFSVWFDVMKGIEPVRPDSGSLQVSGDRG